MTTIIKASIKATNGFLDEVKFIKKNIAIAVAADKTLRMMLLKKKAEPTKSKNTTKQYSPAGFGFWKLRFKSTQDVVLCQVLALPVKNKTIVKRAKARLIIKAIVIAFLCILEKWNK